MKRSDIEFLRIVSSFGVVWYHAKGPHADIAYSGLTIFTSLAIFLSKPGRGDALESIFRKTKRTAPPWILWYIAYGIINLGIGNEFTPKYTDTWYLNILAGSCIHLWFLPFILGALIAVDTLDRALPARTLFWLYLSLSTLSLLLCSEWRATSIESGYPIAQYAQATPAVLIGAFFYYSREKEKHTKVFSYLVIFAATAYCFHIPGIGVPYSIGFIFMATISNFDLSSYFPNNINSVSQTTFGVYLVHLLFVATFNKADLLTPAINSIVSFSVSIISIIIIRNKIPKLARFIS